MNDFSLRYPLNISYEEKILTEEAVNDLSLDFICDTLTKDNFEKNCIKKIMTKITDNKDVIAYRCDVFDDFFNYPQLREALSKILKKLDDLRELERFQKDSEASSMWMLINRLREIDEYIDCISEIKYVLESIEIKSQGMKDLKNMVTEIYMESGFSELKKDIEETFEKAQKLKSITIGVNLDDLLRPKTAGVVSLNDTHFSDSGLIKHFLKFTEGKKDDLHKGVEDVSEMKNFHPANPITSNIIIGRVQKAANNNVHIETNDITGADSLSDALKKTVTDIMRRTVLDIKSTLKKYVNISGYTLISLMPEIIFYIRWAELVEKIRDTGLKMCKSGILDANKRECSFKELYNLKLAIKKVNGEDIDIVGNDIDFNEDMRIFILTGPNRGGKTTFTQAVGLAMMLAQCGIYVPAESAVISPCDNIYTHFPADENDTVDLGRLGEESKRLSEIFNMSTNKSLMLLNESLATTNVAEGLFIAKDVVKAMRYLGARAIFNTHMHELARNLEEINESVDGESKVISMVTGVNEGKRSFKVSLAPPQGVSYAKDIARTYGVTFEKIKSKIDKNSESK